MRLWHAHKIKGDRFLLEFAHAASESSTFAVESLIGDTAGVGMPRAGNVLSITARIDVASVSGGDCRIGVRADGGLLGDGPIFTETGTNQVKTAQIAAVASRRFVALQRLDVLATINGVITVDSLAVLVEIELER
jgi:hypothetical protein